MPFVKRDSDGHIVLVSRNPIDGEGELLSAEDSEIQDFLSTLGVDTQNISATDLDFIRVLEDLVELLVNKGVILFTELPESAREKMILRQRLRSDMAGKLDLLGDD